MSKHKDVGQPEGGLSCDALGVCQQRRPLCSGCTVARPSPLRLAPGVVEGFRVGFLGSPAQRRELLRWVLGAALWLGVVGCGGLAAGVMAGLWP